MHDKLNITDLQKWLQDNYSFRRNVCTGDIELNQKKMVKQDWNTLYVATKRIFPAVSLSVLRRMIDSDFTPDYDPGIR